MTEKAAPAGADKGESLIEVLIALAIMGIAVTGITGVLTTQLAAVGVHRSQSNADTVVTSAVEALKSAAVAYDPTCPAAPPQPYLDAIHSVAVPNDWNSQGWTAVNAVAIKTISYWNGVAFADRDDYPDDAAFAAVNVCHDGDATDVGHLLRMQNIRVTVTSPDGDDTTTLDVVKVG